jgi:hypothetical protein
LRRPKRSESKRENRSEDERLEIVEGQHEAKRNEVWRIFEETEAKRIKTEKNEAKINKIAEGHN